MTARPSVLALDRSSRAAHGSPEDSLTRAAWQPLLFGAPNRADLADCVPTWPCRKVRVRVHRNHGFEPVATAMPAYAAWNGLAYDFAIGGYDDSLSFDLAADADVEVVWVDTDRLQGLGSEVIPWLVSRFQSLRARTSNPILALVWPLEHTGRVALEQAGIPALHVPDLAALAGTIGSGWLDRRAEALSGTRLSNRACLAVARELACSLAAGLRLPADEGGCGGSRRDVVRGRAG